MPDAKPSIAARLAIFYITVGALMGVWTVIYYAFFLRNSTGDGDNRLFWCAGFFFTGLTLMIIGFTLGRIGKSARHADLPPDAVIRSTTPTAQPAAALPPGAQVVVASGVPTAPVPAAPVVAVRR